MTSPPPPPDQQPVPPEVEHQLAMLLLHMAELYALEQLVIKTVVHPLLQHLTVPWRMAALAWTTAFGSLTTRGSTLHMGPIVDQLRAELRGIDTHLSRPLTQRAEQALVLGVRHAATEAGVRLDAREGGRFTLGPVGGSAAARGTGAPQRAADHSDRTLHPTLGPATRTALADVDATVHRHLQTAHHQLGQLPDDPTYHQLTTALAPVTGAGNSANAATTYIINSAANDAATQIADHLGTARLWIAERNACVHCLALAGTIAAPGKPFDATRTFGAKPLPVWPPGADLLGPPRHPHCRCKTTPWYGQADTGLGLPEALQREAHRSILKGWSLESEPERVRLEAAARLLKRGVSAPKSVIAYAERAIGNNRFPSREVPEWDPKRPTKT